MSSTQLTHDLAWRDWIESHADLVHALPDGEFLREDLDEPLQEHVDSLRTNGVLERVGTVRREAERTTDCPRAGTSFYELAKFQVRADASRISETVVENRDPICPCGHSGFRNCGDHFECSAEFCHAEFDRDDLEVHR